jgi:L-alanine-DL-glutamate epimerase-like enolase superfamily enzyme
MIRLYAVKKALFPRHVFRISRAERIRVDNEFLVLEQDGVLGYGEASPNSFFHENAWDVDMALSGLADYFRRQTLDSAEDIRRIWSELWGKLAPSRAAQCAVDLALWDLYAKLRGKTVCAEALGKAQRAVPTSATLGICPPEEWDGRIAELAGFPSIKVKVDASANLDLLKAIRKTTDAAIRVDANGAWGGVDIPALSEKLADLGVEFIEQPMLPDQDHRMAQVLAASRLPIMADESCAGPGDVAALPGRFSGFNIKLVKCGGLTPALAMLREGKALGLKVMIGCMLESSLLISAGLVAAQEADYADLDGSWLLREDPFSGLEIEKGLLRTEDWPGFGVNPLPPRD